MSHKSEKSDSFEAANRTTSSMTLRSSRNCDAIDLNHFTESFRWSMQAVVFRNAWKFITFVENRRCSHFARKFKKEKQNLKPNNWSNNRNHSICFYPMHQRLWFKVQPFRVNDEKLVLIFHLEVLKWILLCVRCKGEQTLFNKKKVRSFKSFFFSVFTSISTKWIVKAKKKKNGWFKVCCIFSVQWRFAFICMNSMIVFIEWDWSMFTVTNAPCKLKRLIKFIIQIHRRFFRPPQVPRHV